MGKSYERGLATRRKVLGDEWVDRAIAGATPFNADFQKMITSYAWDGVWNRGGISHRVRRMLVIAMTTALGRWEEFRLHVRAALASGDLGEDEVREVLMQAAIYCGVPAANTGFREARDVIAELGGAGKAARKPARKGARKPAKKAAAKRAGARRKRA
jgi:4-carboxymuconolactone decarboxylase